MLQHSLTAQTWQPKIHVVISEVEGPGAHGLLPCTARLHTQPPARC